MSWKGLREWLERQGCFPAVRRSLKALGAMVP